MDEPIALTCTNCGSPLHVPPSATWVTCAYCKTPLSVERTGDAYFTERIGDQLDRIERQYLAVADGVEEVRRSIAMQELKERQAYFRAHRNGSERSLVTLGCGPQLILAIAIAGSAILASRGIDGALDTRIDNIAAAALGGIGVVWGALVVAAALRRRIGVDDEIEDEGMDDGWDESLDDAIIVDDSASTAAAPSTTSASAADDQPRLVDR